MRSSGVGTTAGQIVAIGVYQALVAVLTVDVAFAARHPAGTLSVLVSLPWALPSVLLGLGGDAPHAFPYPPDHAHSAPQPRGATCEFYRSGRDLLDRVDLYRLCWSDRTLLTKDTLRAHRD
ncbi:hypothetical protein ACU4GG_02145 [Streptomyces nojiriensis]